MSRVAMNEVELLGFLSQPLIADVVTLKKGGSTSGVGFSPGARGAWRIGVGFLRAFQSKFLTDAMWTTPGLTWPRHFSEGQYNLAAYTYGYVQDKDFTAYVMNGQVADMKINLIIGVNITLDIL